MEMRGTVAGSPFGAAPCRGLPLSGSDGHAVVFTSSAYKSTFPFR